MAETYPCPVEGCDHEPFKTSQALASHIRSVHPEVPGHEGPAREVPIVEDDFATLLRKFRIKADLAANIAENVSQTGGPRVFEDPDTLLKRLTLWSTEIHPDRRKNIIDQWFAQRGIDIPPDVKQKAGMTTEQIQEAEKTTKEDDKVRYVFDEEKRLVRMAKKDERGGTIIEAKELLKMAEEVEKKDAESPFMQDGEGRWVLNPKARVTGLEYMAVQVMQKSQEKGEPVDPIAAMTQAAERMKTLRETFGGGGTTLPAWMTDPVAFTTAIKTIMGGNGGDSALKAEIAEMRKSMEVMKDERWAAMFAGQQKQIADLGTLINKAIDTMSDIEKRKVGRTEMDIIHEIATEGIGLLRDELPGVRRDIKEAVGSISLPAAKTAEQREERKGKIKQALETDKKIDELGRRLYLSQS